MTDMKDIPFNQAEQNLMDQMSGESYYAETNFNAYHTNGALWGLGGIAETQNYGQSTTIWQREYAQILERQYRDMLIGLFAYENSESIPTITLETMLRGLTGGVVIGPDDKYNLNIIGTASALSMDNGYNLRYSKPIFNSKAQNIGSKLSRLTPDNPNGHYVIVQNRLNLYNGMTTDFSLLYHYCEYLAMIEATKRLNILQLRSPYVIQTPKGGVSANELQRKILSGDAFIQTNSSSGLPQEIKHLTLPNTINNLNGLTAAYESVFSEMCNMLGIYANPQNKRAQVGATEININNHITEALGDIYLEPRRQAMKLLNQRYGTNIQVNWNSPQARAARSDQSAETLDENKKTRTIKDIIMGVK